MSNEQGSPGDIDYAGLVIGAYGGVIRRVLDRVAREGELPGEHHFYLTFRTQAPQVSAPAELVARYPQEMTIVLQNQFWDLNPGETAFSVTLRFGGQPKSLSIPYAAVTRFYDPYARFTMQYEPQQGMAAGWPEGPPPRAEAEAPPPPPPAAAPSKPAADAPKVVSLDQFRKR